MQVTNSGKQDRIIKLTSRGVYTVIHDVGNLLYSTKNVHLRTLTAVTNEYGFPLKDAISLSDERTNQD